MIALILFGTFFFLVILNVPISIALGASALATLFYNDISVTMMALVMYSAIGKFTLLAIPFFILAGYIMEQAGISRRLIYFAEMMLEGVYGGLALVTVFVTLIFAAISGSGPATVAALGGILIPAMVAQGYHRGMAAALLSASGSIGIIIPPSVAFIVYASIAEVSISKLFLAGVVPGIIIALSFIVCSFFLIRRRKISLQTSSIKHTRQEKWQAFKDAFWGLLAPFIILGGIYGGLFTPTESAGVAVIYGLFVGFFIYKELSVKKVISVLVEASTSTAVVMYIVATASLFAWVLTSTQVAQQLSSDIISVVSHPVFLLLLMNFIFLAVGFFLDTISAYFILTPIMLPVAASIGVDPIHFGVIMTVNLAIGQFTPPVGVNLFVASNVGKVPLQEVIVNVIPYIIAAIISLLIITFVPEISGWLPSLIGGRS